MYLKTMLNTWSIFFVACEYIFCWRWVALVSKPYLREIIRLFQPFNKTSLTADLSSYFIMRESSCRKKRDLLSTSYGIHDINGRNSRLYHLFWIGSLTWVNGTSWIDKEGIYHAHTRKKCKVMGYPLFTSHDPLMTTHQKYLGKPQARLEVHYLWVSLNR